MSDNIKWLHSVPDGSRLLDDFASVDFLESVCILDGGKNSAREVANRFFELPGWVLRLFVIRDVIVKRFGLKTSEDYPSLETPFPVLWEGSEELIMGEADKHLDFKLSVIASQTAGASYITTILHYHNFWGRLYFFFVKIVHGTMMRSMLKNYLS